MKRLKITFNVFIATLTLGFLLSSCKKEQENSCSGTPVITKISTAENRSTALTSGNFEQWIIVQGQNLCAAQSVKINDVEIGLTDAYVTSTEITFKIPKARPSVVDNKLKVTTSAGTAEFPYSIIIPPTAISKAVNEFAVQGGPMVLLGSNFDLFDFESGKGKLYIGSHVATITKVKPDSLFITVPVGAVAGDRIKMVSASGEEKTASFLYRDNRGLIFDFDGKNGSETVGTITAGGAGVPVPISGNYIRINRTVGSFSTDVIVIAGYTVLPAAVVANPENYLFKFEYNTQKPFETNLIKIFPDRVTGSSPFYSWAGAPANNTNGQWKTFVIDLIAAAQVSPMPTKSQNLIRIAFHGGGELAADISFDNIRITPKTL